MSDLKHQVCAILNSKIHRIAVDCYRRANHRPVPMHKQPKPYTLPVEAHEMVAMLGRTDIATDSELEEMAHYATTGAVQQLVFYPCS